MSCHLLFSYHKHNVTKLTEELKGLNKMIPEKALLAEQGICTCIVLLDSLQFLDCNVCVLGWER